MQILKFNRGFSVILPLLDLDAGWLANELGLDPQPIPS